MINRPKFITTLIERTETNVSSWSLKRKLFFYMLLLVGLLILFLMSALFLSGQFNSTEKETFDALDMQMGVYEKYVSDHFDSIAAAGINLSRNMTSAIEHYLQSRELSFSDLTDNASRISEIQQLFLDPLIQQLHQENCSGVYFMLDTTINSALEYSATSRAGMYLQTNGYKSSYNPVSLLFGNAEIARQNGITPHRQWHLEFDTSLFPVYEKLKQPSGDSVAKQYRYTDLFTFPGTETRVMLLCVPMIDSQGVFYGICGFEISESYFMSHYAQPTKVDYLTYLLTPKTDQTAINAEMGLSCGESDGYYRVPKGILTVHDLGNGLSEYQGNDISYIGLSQTISLSPNNPLYALTVLMRKADYDRDHTSETVRILLVWLLSSAAAVSLCFFFSRKFLIPLLKSIEQIKSNAYLDEQTSIPEIDDLFAFLSEKDRRQEKTLKSLSKEKQEILSKHEQLKAEHSAVTQENRHLQTEFEKAQIELSRLAYSRKLEVDPDDYAYFLEGIKTLTPTERKIFDLYLSGMSVKDISKENGIAESTVYFHNKNIYSKLGINSLKQLLRYSALMQHQEKEGELIL